MNQVTRRVEADPAAGRLFDVGECVSMGELNPAIIMERQQGNRYVLWNIFDDDGRISHAPGCALEAITPGGKTCLICPYWRGHCTA